MPSSLDSTVTRGDEEKTDAAVKTSDVERSSSTAPHPVEIEADHGPFGKLSRYLASAGVEARGLERVPENERTQSSGWGQLLFWSSVNLSFSALATGSLGGQYYTLSFPTTCAVIFPMCALGCALSAWVAVQGPRYGLRTMALTRFTGGIPGTFIFSLLNILTQLSYSVTTALSGAQALHAINHDLSLIVGIVVVSVVVFVLSVFGYNVVQQFERYVWIVCFIIYCIILGLGARGGYDVHRLSATQDTGAELIGDVLSFAGIMFSVSSSWTSIAADYNVHLPADTPKWRTFWLTWLGIYLPVTFTCTTSAAFMTITNPDYIAAHEADALGGIVGAILGPVGGFGKFLLVLLAFSTVAANVPNTYSGALCMQSLAPILLKVPRVLFVCLFTVIYLVAAIVGRESFSEIVANFAALLSYWTAFLFVILFLEIEWFRRPSGPLGDIDADNFNDWTKLPPGFACVGAIGVAIAGIVPSMAETFYTGPIALMVAEPYGGDLGFEFSAVFSCVSYFIFRTIEIKIFKR